MREMDSLTLHCDISRNDTLRVADFGGGEIVLTIIEDDREANINFDDRKKIMALYEWLSAYLYPGFSGVFPEKKEEEVPVTKDRKISKGDIVTIRGVVGKIGEHDPTRLYAKFDTTGLTSAGLWLDERQILSVEERPIAVGDTVIEEGYSTRWEVVAIDAGAAWLIRDGQRITSAISTLRRA